MLVQINLKTFITSINWPLKVAQLLNLLWSSGLLWTQWMKLNSFAVQSEEQSGLTELRQMKGSAHLSDTNNQWEKIQEMKENPKCYFEYHHNFACVKVYLI